MKQPYDWNRRPLGSPLPRGNVRRGAPQRRKPEAPPPDRTAVRIIVGCVVAAVAIALAATFALRGSARDPKAAGKPDSWDWTAEEYVVKEAIFEPPPASPADSGAPPVARAAPPEAPPPAKESAAPTASVAARAKKAPKAAAPGVAKPAAPKAAGENRFFTLVLSGTLGDEELDPDDGQTWARLSYFLREEARRPHFLVYPDGSVPVSVPAAADGKPAPESRVADVPEPEGDAAGDPHDPTPGPAYRLVVEASAGEGAGVTFYRQRLASTYRSRVSCRIEKRTGDEWKLLRSVSADESLNLSKDTGAEPATCMRQVYDASIEKLLRQLAGQPPFAAAPTATTSR